MDPAEAGCAGDLVVRKVAVADSPEPKEGHVKGSSVAAAVVADHCVAVAGVGIAAGASP